MENGKLITRLVRIPINVRIIPQETSKGEDVNQVAADGSDLDLDTRERLARLELEEAIAKRDLAKNEFEAHKGANEKARGSTPEPEMRKLEAAIQLAEIGAKRANVNLGGLARQRAELEARAAAAFAEATAAQQKAAAGVRISKTASAIDFHTDSSAAYAGYTPDIVALLGLRAALIVAGVGE